MIREILDLLSKNGKRSMGFSILFFTLYGLCGTALMLIVFHMLFQILNAPEGKSFETLYLDWLLLLGVMVAKGLLNMCADLTKHHAGFDIVQQIRERTIIKLKRFSLGFYTDERLGELSTILHKDVDNMSLVVGHTWTRMSADFLVAAILFAGLLFTNWQLALIMLAGLPFALWFLTAKTSQGKRLEKENGNALADMVSLFVEYVRGIPVLKSFAENPHFQERLERATEIFGETSKNASRMKAKQLAIYGFLLDVTYWLMVFAGALCCFYQKLEIHKYLLFVVLAREFYKPFINMETHWRHYVSVCDSYRRLQRILGAPLLPEPGVSQISTRHDITFDNVSFIYGEGTFALRNIDFHIPEKSMTALVGESGSGKTSVTNLLLRFWDVNQGEVRIGGVNLQDMKYDDLLDRISIVMQNVQLFADSIAENLRVGKRGATQHEIEEAAKAARIHDFILGLPEGYKTKIGENGIGLSGGQRQRISIARAFLKDAPILILDEMTSNVDPINESLIQEAVSELAKDRTVLVIAHHLNTIRSADQIIVFRRGAIVQKGTHQNLLKETEGYYNLLWNQMTYSRDLTFREVI